MDNAARLLAQQLHAGQLDKAGQPYFNHLARVVQNLLDRWGDVSKDDIAAAWLHDVLEDTNATVDQLRAAGISDRTITIITLLTRPRGTPYLDWIRGLAATGDLSAIKVKIADNQDNSDAARVSAIPDGPAMLRTRYIPARAILEEALHRLT